MSRPLSLILAAVLTLAPLTLAPAVVQAQDLMAHALNKPAADQWSSFGTGESHKLAPDDTVRGGWAYTVSAAQPGQNPWDVQAGITTTQAVKSGDVLLLAFWARAVTPPAGATSISAPAVIQEASAPYTRLGTENLTITPDWKLYYVTGTAQKDYLPQALQGSVQVASAAQSVALGPVFLLDYGPGYNLSYLPVNDPQAARADTTKKKK
ncbi:hypothetical protein [Asticcacaulis sp. EMRT-3]|uniref:hypothetical protein n=1 Tax=Asticcacaulis sp. EMRT-3 TaxID=3040349 RepID=UPI0024AF6615|nr:hypothetical protein [Asticcacaulis sp. EMRT-3]MDI7776302.1 hypothetical protein [Asticcacaulis sp. EMRT-3]